VLNSSASWSVLALSIAVTVAVQSPATAASQPEADDARLPAIETHDNRRAAGVLAHGVLALDLRVGVGVWKPEGDDGPALRIEAIGEAGRALSAPAPLIRVPQGTEIVAAIRNELSARMRLHGFCERGAAACTPIDIESGQSRQVRFKSGRPGTYHYWATTTGMPLPFRGTDDTQLSGAFIVDEGASVADTDRIFVVTEWTSLTRDQLADLAAQDDPGATFLKMKPAVRFLINGRSWPHTERLTYNLGERVHWRIVNLSTQLHPMHLHGFYFDVDSIGDGVRDARAAEDARQRVVTQLMPPGSTLALTWTPERAGNWLFHCHVMTHVSPTLNIDGSPKSHVDHAASHDSNLGMTGMVLGITVNDPDGAAPPAGSASSRAARALRLVMQDEANRFGEAPAYGFMLDRPNDAAHVPVPGPLLVLTHGEPVEITLINRLPEATSIHWHGMELESYYDGVHGWSGSGQRVTPLIEPGGSFVVRFTPPRAGTFMYHTHLHDQRQLTSGLYGPMLVLEPGDTFDEATDHVFIVGRAGPAIDAPAIINGEREPKVTWKSGIRHRIRLINITPGDVFSITLQTRQGPVTWQPLTKDGMPLPSSRTEPAPAQQVIAVGETYDFEYQAPPGRQTLWLEARSPGGKWQAQGQVIVR
jgi:FtsP/CotA-like multicopper oxidase with cupredoxin domain